MLAALNGHLDVVDTLLQHGVTVDKPNRVSTMDKLMQLGSLSNKYWTT